jgi:hypothetical protein
MQLLARRFCLRQWLLRDVSLVSYSIHVFVAVQSCVGVLL